jgi:hypothetical protein
LSSRAQSRDLLFLPLSRSRRCRAMSAISAIGAKSAPTLPRLRSQSSHFGVDFNSCCPSRSRDQPINRSPDFCLRAFMVGVCSPDRGDVGDLGDRREKRAHPPPPSIPVIPFWRRLQQLLSFPITRSADQPITRFLSPCLRGWCLLSRCRRCHAMSSISAIPPPAIHSTRSQSSHFGVGFNSCCPSRSRDQPINRSPDSCPALVIPGASDFIERTRCPYFSRLSFRASRSACDGERGTPGMQIGTMQLQGILTKQKIVTSSRRPVRCERFRVPIRVRFWRE